MKKIVILLFCLLSCSKPKIDSTKTPLILLSVEPYVMMVEEIGGDFVRAKCVLPSYVDPHNWEPKHKDLVEFDQAKIWFTIGEGFESPLLKKLKSINKDLKNVSLSNSIEKISSTCDHHHNHDHCSFDTHFWLDPLIDIKQAKIICDTLSSLMPEKASIFEDNYFKLMEKLTKINQSLQSSLKKVESKILVTSHGAYTYFCKRYHIQQFVIEPSEGKEPRPKDLTKLVTELKKEYNQILGIFTQPQHSNKAAKILAQALNLPIHSVDPYKKNFLESIVLLETYLSEDENSHH